MRKDDILDVSNAYSYKLNLNQIKQNLPKAPKKHKVPAKRYVCIDLEMTEFTAAQRSHIPGANGEVIQFGAVLLDENYNLLSEFSSYVKPVYSSVNSVINQILFNDFHICRVYINNDANERHFNYIF